MSKGRVVITKAAVKALSRAVIKRLVDKTARLALKQSQVEAAVKPLKERLRAIAGPGGWLEGRDFVCSVSEQPKQYAKVDYRTWLLEYVEEADIAEAEKEAGERIVDYGTARVTFSAHPARHGTERTAVLRTHDARR